MTATTSPKRHRIDIPAGCVSSRDIKEQSGASYRQVDYWCHRGILKSHTGNIGSGNFRYFDPEEIRVAKFFVKFSELGLLSSCFDVRDLADVVRSTEGNAVRLTNDEDYDLTVWIEAA